MTRDDTDEGRPRDLRNCFNSDVGNHTDDLSSAEHGDDFRRWQHPLTCLTVQWVTRGTSWKIDRVIVDYRGSAVIGKSRVLCGKVVKSIQGMDLRHYTSICFRSIPMNVKFPNRFIK